MIDHHAHPFALEGGPFDPSSISLDVHTDPEADQRRRREGPTRLFQELLVRRLADRLGCRPEEVAAARAEASSDWPAYAAGLFADAGISALLLDAGYAPDAESRIRDYARTSGCAVYPVARIEPLLDQLIEEGRGAGEIVQEVEDWMVAQAAQGAVGFKTIAAYRTGLAVDPGVSLADAERSLRTEEPVRRRGKACRDLVIRRAFGVAADLGRPFQVHTGIGDSDIRLAESNPLLLEELLRTPEGRAVQVVLIHGSFPWVEELAFLATVRPNVHADISLHPIFAPATVSECLLHLLNLAPAAKVLLGTDGHGEPEVFWFAGHVLREGWARARSRLRELGAGESWLEETEDRLFERNTRELYGL